MSKTLLNEEFVRTQKESQELATSVLKEQEKNAYDLSQRRLAVPLTEEEEALVAAQPTLRAQHAMRLQLQQRARASGRRLPQSGTTQTRAPISTHFGSKFSTFSDVAFDRKRDLETIPDRGKQFEREGWSAILGGGLDRDLTSQFAPSNGSDD